MSKLEMVRKAFKLAINTPLDLLRAGIVSLDPVLLRTELFASHRVRERQFITDMLPKGGVGAEIGVFTGMFSTVLLDRACPREIYFVDVWWKEFGPRYPDWGRYTDRGRLGTKTAYRAAAKRIAKHAGDARVELLVDYSAKFLAELPDHYLDWAYLDTSHSYEQTLEEVSLLQKKLKPGGILVGDDWNESPGHHHYGLSQAVNEVLASGGFRLIGLYPSKQWAIATS
ncbi:MAG: class I SAM-dependent methyltransferase [Novosphingobium sp.]|nr:class I SAM-dependent methyltransferase [Novosphingobium sp.]